MEKGGRKERTAQGAGGGGAARMCMGGSVMRDVRVHPQPQGAPAWRLRGKREDRDSGMAAVCAFCGLLVWEGRGALMHPHRLTWAQLMLEREGKDF